MTDFTESLSHEDINNIEVVVEDDVTDEDDGFPEAARSPLNTKQHFAQGILYDFEEFCCKRQLPFSPASISTFIKSIEDDNV